MLKWLAKEDFCIGVNSSEAASSSNYEWLMPLQTRWQ
jgi:hypothetical protein